METSRKKVLYKFRRLQLPKISRFFLFQRDLESLLNHQKSWRLLNGLLNVIYSLYKMLLEIFWGPQSLYKILRSLPSKGEEKPRNRQHFVFIKIHIFRSRQNMIIYIKKIMYHYHYLNFGLSTPLFFSKTVPAHIQIQNVIKNHWLFTHND